MKVAIKYCGSCNPYIDLAQIAKHLNATAASKGFTLVTLSEEEIDLIVILNGCPRACAGREDVRNKAAQSLVIAGKEGSFGKEKVIISDMDQALEAYLRSKRERCLL